MRLRQDRLYSELCDEINAWELDYAELEKRYEQLQKEYAKLQNDSIKDSQRTTAGILLLAMNGMINPEREG